MKMKKELQLKKSLALLGHGKWKSALGHTLLLIGFLMGFGMMNAFAQEATGGLYMHKEWVPNLRDRRIHGG